MDLTMAAQPDVISAMSSKRARKPIFTDAQKKILIATVEKHLKGKTFKTQEELALALDITQPALSSLIHGRWTPGRTTATHIAALEKMTLEQLIGPITDTGKGAQAPPSRPSKMALDNLEVCVRFYADKKEWSPWTVAAARAGIFGEGDVAPARWAERLDIIEKALGKIVAA